MLHNRRYMAEIILIRHRKKYSINQTNLLIFLADFWIGLTDDSLEGKWEWLPSGATPSYTEWAPGQPDNGHNEDCALMSRSKDYHWNDDQCDNNHHFICERE